MGDDLLKATRECAVNLMAAISLLKTSPKSGAPSDRMFDQMVKDYEGALKRTRAAIAKAESR